MNQGMGRQAAFKKVEEEMYERRMKLEKEQKIHMAVFFKFHLVPPLISLKNLKFQTFYDTLNVHIIMLSKIVGSRSRRRPHLPYRSCALASTMGKRRNCAFELDSETITTVTIK